MSPEILGAAKLIWMALIICLLIFALDVGAGPPRR